MFSIGSSSSISLATVTPSLVTVGLPNFLSMTTLRPLGPSVTFTASASWSTPRLSRARASVLNSSCFAGIAYVLRRSAELRVDVGLLDHQDLLAVDLERLAAVLRVEHPIAHLDLDGNELPLLQSSRAN